MYRSRFFYQLHNIILTSRVTITAQNGLFTELYFRRTWERGHTHEIKLFLGGGGRVWGRLVGIRLGWAGGDGEALKFVDEHSHSGKLFQVSKGCSSQEQSFDGTHIGTHTSFLK